MRVRMLRSMANPAGNADAGAVIDLPDEEAEQRIAAGHCTAVDEPRRRLRRTKTEPDGPKPIDKMTVDELKTYAAEHGIDLGDATKKNDILAKIEAAQDED